MDHSSHHHHHHSHQGEPAKHAAVVQVDEHAGHHTEDFLKRFWICLALTVPILLLSPMIQHWLKIDWRFQGDQIIVLLLGSVLYFYGGAPFLKGLVRELKAKDPGMMTLVAVAITTAYLYSIAVVLGLEGMDFFWELATLIDIMLLGHWLEMKSQMAASQALESLVKLLPAEVHVVQNDQVIDIPLSELKRDDLMVIKPGEKVPADGRVVEGHSSVNESMLTGESIPVVKHAEMEVIGGSINGDGVLRVKVTGTGEDSYLNKVIRLVGSAQHSKSKTQNLAHRVAKWLTLISLAVGISTFVYWLGSGAALSFALERMVTVMVTACPHALGVAIPLVVAISTSLAARQGLLIRNRTAFENTRRLSTIIFDKTGTVTEGSHEVAQLIPASTKYSADDLLIYAAAVQQHSEHHIARGMISALKKKNLPLKSSNEFQYRQGVGVSAMVEGKNVFSVGPNYFRENKLELPAIPDSVDQAIETVTFLLIDDELAGLITLGDQIRAGSVQAVAALQEMGIRTFLLTGDNDKVAGSVAKKLKMDGYLANVLPDEKQEKVKSFQLKGELVAMTGDGVNDAPALAQADVGIAVGSGTDVAAETADIILVNSDPQDVVSLIQFGKATYRKMIQNLAWAVGYNIIAIPLAAGVLYPEFVLSPALGAVLMSASTVIVALNAQLLNRTVSFGNK
ncbi:copper-translocating P-type ATPase [Flavihumibacter cheonanensis]|uniref:copper-translocating P-type ATPase n=1 Tax=Flavihumibacter cheonanensis TaxID=1442385 RepID=UPI001EF8A933|nr:copper-translocating P-type ATPase [Flavihumibacter cheonanensis]MCG7753839.1 copper-translocating P-type ATPase [Flavihumibacter cheonanensis]